MRLRGGRPVATDGPHAEAHDVIGGCFTIVADSDAPAEALAAHHAAALARRLRALGPG